MSEGCGVVGNGETEWGEGALDFEACTSPCAAGSLRAEACARRHFEASEWEEDGDAPQCPQCARVFSLSAGRTPKVLPCQHLCCLECVVGSMCRSVAACAECGASHCLLALAEPGSLVEPDSSCPRELARRLPTCLILEELLSLLSPPRLPAGQAALLTNSSPAGAAETGNASSACPHVAGPLSAEALPHSISQPAHARAPAVGRSCLASDEFVFDDSVAPTAPNSRFCIRMQKLPADRMADPADSLPSHATATGDPSMIPAAAGKKAGERGDAAATIASKRANNLCRQRHLQKNRLRGIDLAQNKDSELLLDLPLSLLPEKAALENARSMSPTKNLHAQQCERLGSQHQLHPHDITGTKVRFSATTSSCAINQPSSSAAPAPALLVASTKETRESKRHRKPVMRTKSSDLRGVRSSVAHVGMISGNVHPGWPWY